MNAGVLTKATAILLTLGASIGIAQAADQASGKTNWYGGVNIGRTDLKANGGDVDDALRNQGITSSTSLDNNDTAYSLNIGYKFNPYFAVEGGYTDLGKYGFSSNVTAPAATTLNGNYKVDGVNLSAVGILPLSNGFSVYGKAGVFRASTDLDVSSSGAVATSSTSNHSTNPTYGLGASYDITKDWTGKLEWNRFHEVGDSNTGKDNIDLYTIGIAYNF
jgi:OOP family OmpA-OmpF porin